MKLSITRVIFELSIYGEGKGVFDKITKGLEAIKPIYEVVKNKPLYTILRYIAILSSAILLLVSLISAFDLSFNLTIENEDIRNMLTQIIEHGYKVWLLWFFVGGFLLSDLLRKTVTYVVKITNRDLSKDVPRSACVYALFDILEVAYHFAYLLFACCVFGKALLCNETNVINGIFIIPLLHVLFVFIAYRYNKHYNGWEKAYSDKLVTPYCDSTGKTLYVEDEVYYLGFKYTVYFDKNDKKHKLLPRTNERKTVILSELNNSDQIIRI